MSIDLSLDRLRVLATHLQPYTRPTIHIAGTNGKGSVSALVSSILLSAAPPFRVGRYNSPHLVNVYDCITLDNAPVSPELYALCKGEVERLDDEHGTKLTSFEVLTMTALQIFEKEKVDVVVLEVGMGGRLDATNIVSDPCILVSALTSVDLDHQNFLGNTVAKIAREKAAIARTGRPFVLGKQAYPEVEGVVEEIVASVGGRVVPALDITTQPTSTNFSLLQTPASFAAPPSQSASASLRSFDGPIEVSLPLHGAHQLDNLSTALTIVDVLRSSYPDLYRHRLSREAIQDGVHSVSWPGRLSFHQFPLPGQDGPIVVLADGAHNQASAKTLSSYITYLLSLSPTPSPDSTLNLTFILALSYSPSKTSLETLAPLLPPTLPDNIACPRIKVSIALPTFSIPEGMPWVKPVPSQEVAEVISNLVPDADIFILAAGSSQDPLDPLREIFKWISEGREKRKGSGSQNGELVVLAGSLYLVADFYRLLDQLK